LKEIKQRFVWFPSKVHDAGPFFICRIGNTTKAIREEGDKCRRRKMVSFWCRSFIRRNVMPYPDGPLKTRAVVKPGIYALVPPEGRVFNVIPGLENCRTTILCTPKIGAGFVQYIGTAQAGGGCAKSAFGAAEGVETFIHFLDGEGELELAVGGRTETFGQGGYAYAPAGKGIHFKNVGAKPLRFLLYKQRYIPHPDPARVPAPVFGNLNDIKERSYDEMENVFVRDLLPVDETYDMNMHTLSFAPGGCHPFIETHVQEHGAYIYEGQGMYLLDDDWLSVQPEDFLWFGPYTKQACYGTGRGRLSYIYSKDCHRDVEI
jgi:(S)-ureidoglycine aminohydrolase